MRKNISLRCRRQEMDSTKHRVQINVEACRLNLGKAVRRDSSTKGFKRTYIDLSFSSETRKDVERQVYFTFTLQLGMHSGRVVFPRPWTDSLSYETCRRAVKAQWSSEAPRQEEGMREEMTSNRCLSTKCAIQSHPPITPWHPCTHTPLFLPWAQSHCPNRFVYFKISLTAGLTNRSHGRQNPISGLPEKSVSRWWWLQYSQFSFWVVSSHSRLHLPPKPLQCSGI